MAKVLQLNLLEGATKNWSCKQTAKISLLSNVPCMQIVTQTQQSNSKCSHVWWSVVPSDDTSNQTLRSLQEKDCIDSYNLHDLLKAPLNPNKSKSTVSYYIVGWASYVIPVTTILLDSRTSSMEHNPYHCLNFWPWY